MSKTLDENPPRGRNAAVAHDWSRLDAMSAEEQACCGDERSG